MNKLLICTILAIICYFTTCAVATDDHAAQSMAFFQQRKAEMMLEPTIQLVGESGTIVDTTILSTTFGLDISQLHSADQMACFQKAGYKFMVPRGFRSSGTVDPNAIANVKNAHNANIPYVDLYFFPKVVGKSVEAQVKEFNDHFAGVNFGMIWIDVEANELWTGNKASNRAFLENLLAQFSKQSHKVGLYVNQVQWNAILGSDYRGSGGYPTWVARYNQSTSCADLAPFGDYKKFDVKQYQGTTSLCGGSVDFNVWC